MNATRLLRPLKGIAANPVAQALALRNGAAVPIRVFSTTPSTNFSATESDILQKQRANRPTSPHLTIYQPQLTWYMSSVHRITGFMVTAAFYSATLSYLAGPYFGYAFDSSAIVSSMAALPAAGKIAIKSTLAFPFVFHSLNGIRHLIWDTGSALTMKGVYATGYAVLGGTVLGSLYLASL